MDLIHDNPYRIAGILSNATTKELEKQKGKIRAFSKVGKEIKSEYDFNILAKITRTEDSINIAFSNIEQNQDKVNFALFWFIEDLGLNHLVAGNAEKAVQIWEQVTLNKEVNSKNFSAFNNLGTYKLLGKTNGTIKEGIEAKIKLIESKYFENFVHSVADETLTIDHEKQIKKLVDELLIQFKNLYTSSEILQLFSNCNGTTQKHLSQKFTEEPIHNIESKIESTKNKRKNNNSGAYKFGLGLYTNCKDDLSLLKSLLGVNDLKYKAVADQLANEIMQCGIDYFNECEKNESSEKYLESAQSLTKIADGIAVGKLTKNRAKDSLASLEEMRDREILQAIAVIESVKDAYETNKAKIKRQIKELEQNDIELKYGLKKINYSAVEDNIKNSIDWRKVNELIREALSDKNLKKIKESNRNESKNKFWELMNWLEEHSLRSSTISAIIDKYKSIPPKICFEIISADVVNTGSNSNIIDKPFFVEDIRYVGLKLNVNSIGNQKVTIYKKYINQEGKYKNSPKTSPKGYTSFNEITITPETKIINLGGWGNEKECTYPVGEHKIEIYVEHYKVYTKVFQVDWSPKKKAKLTENLNLLQNEMREVQQFKWFRASETRQKELQVVQGKIEKATKIIMNK